MQSNEGGWRKLSISNKAHCSTVKSTRNTRKQECCYRGSFRRKENTEDGTTIVGRFPVFRLPLFDNWPKNKYTLHTTLSVFFLLLVPGMYIFKQLLSIIPQLAPYKLALPLDVKPKCSLLVGPFSLVS